MIRAAVATVEWWQIILALVAAGMLGVWSALLFDARRQQRRREDRQAYREFMAGRWGL